MSLFSLLPVSFTNFTFLKVLDTEDIDVVRLCFKRGEIWPKLINFLSSYFDGTEGITGDSSSLNEIFSCLELCLFFREGTQLLISTSCFKIFFLQESRDRFCHSYTLPWIRSG